MWKSFALSSIFLLALVLLGQGVRMRQLFASLNLNVLEFMLLLFYMAPTFLLIVIPFSCMLSIFMTLMRMNSDRELVALKAGGVSVIQLLPSPMWFAGLCCAATLLLSLYGISWGTAEFRSTIMQLANTRAKLNIQPGIFNQDIDGVTLFARQISPETSAMRQVIIEDKSGAQGSGMTILAPLAEIGTDESTGDLVFKLWNGKSYVNKNSGVGSVVNFKYLEHRVNVSRLLSGFALDDIKPRDMSWRELKRHQGNFDKDADAKFINRVHIELQKRWSLPMACLVLGLFAVPLACSFANTRKHISVVLALLTFLTYYSIYSAGITLGEAGRLSPALAMWLPNAVFLACGLIGLTLCSREGAPNLSNLLSFRRKARKRTEAAR